MGKPLKLPPATDPVWGLFRSGESARREEHTPDHTPGAQPYKPTPPVRLARQTPPTTAEAARPAANAASADDPWADPLHCSCPQLLAHAQAVAALAAEPEPALLHMRSMRLEAVGYDRQTQRYTCLCDCGKTVSIIPGSLASGNSKSCGCWQVELNLHAELLGALDPERLCETDPRLERLRGVHARWWREWAWDSDPELNSFTAFYTVLGPKPRTCAEVTRPDVWLPYAPGNIEWSIQPDARPKVHPPTEFRDAQG